MNRNNANRNLALRNQVLTRRAITDLQWDLRNRKWSPFTIAGLMSQFILDPEQ